MKKINVLFYVFIFIFLATAVVTLVAVVGWIEIKENHLNLLLTSLIVEVAACIISLFKKTTFFPSLNNKKTEASLLNINFIYRKFEMQTIIRIDGSMTYELIAEIEVTHGELEQRDHFMNLSGYKKFDKPRISIEGSSHGKNVFGTVFRETDRSLGMLVKFSPVLTKNETANYKVKTESLKGPFSMTLEELYNQIKESKLKSNEPYEKVTNQVRFPTEYLVNRVMLPIEYNISGKEFWDVLVGEAFERENYNYKKLKEENSFKDYVSQDGKMRVFEITVKKPQIGLGYTIKWIPPKENEMIKTNNT